MNANLHESFLQLVRLGIGHTDTTGITDDVDWPQLKALADVQGLSAVVLDGIDWLKVQDSKFKVAIPQSFTLQWIGEVLQNFEQRYKQYENAIGSLARFYNQHGFKMMVLKGYACSIDWEKSEHRPCGDIDIWLFGEQKEADEALNAWLKDSSSKLKVDTSHHHHTVFEWQGFTVENHYDFVNVYDYESSKRIEKIFKKLGEDDSISIEVCGETVYLPSPDLHALFLMRHLVSHFASVSITLRQVMDWAFFVEKHTKEIDWNWLEGKLNMFHMLDFYNCINAICVGDLGFNVSIFRNVQFDPILKDKVLKDILEHNYSDEEPRALIKRMIYKYRRWQDNAWKQNLCYGENRYKSFLKGLWGHILKPTSI